MVSAQILQSAIDDLKNITRVDLAIVNPEGRVDAGTYDIMNDEITRGEIISFAESSADTQEIKGHYFYKVYDDLNLEYVLIARGASDTAYMVGKVAVSEVKNLVIAYKERFDKNNFIQNLLLDNLLLVDIYNRSKKLGISIEAKRSVYVIETKSEKDNIAMETIKNFFGNSEVDFITVVDDKNIVIVKEIDENENDREYLAKVASSLLDTLNAEAMSSVKLAYGTVVTNIKDVSKSFKEAKMAIEVGKIFFADRNIIPYSELGIGRLIYQLPIPLCRTFLTEIFKEGQLESLDDESLSTINAFFDNSLNISETSRKLFVHRNTLVYRIEKLYRSTGLDIRVFEDALIFKLALMVKDYMTSKKQM